VTTAKGLGGGLPIGACMLGEKVQGVFGFGDHGSTFGGNPIACAGAVSILSRLDEECLKGVREREELIRQTLSGKDGIGKVSGMGLMLGIETAKPAGQVAKRCLEEGVLVLTCGVDTQDDRLEFEVVGHGRYGETWGIKKGVIMGDPGYNEPWERLDDVIDHVYKFKDGQGLTISMTFVDSGGHKTQEVYKQCRARLQKRVFAIKGQGGDGVPYTKPPSKVKIIANGAAVGQTWLYSIGVDAGKADIMGALKVQESGPRYCHFPKGIERGYDNAFFTGLLSEKLVMKSDRGRTRWAWVKLPGHERNEALDCRNYAMAAFRVLDPDMEKVAERLRQKAEGKAPVPIQQPKRRPKVSRGIAGGDDW
jgi:phage terminase large subunit GpA-like protein